MGQFSLIEFLIQRLYEEKIEDIVISPGSRNAPIIEALVKYNKFTLHSIVDERSAAFFALGCTIQTKKPTVLVCTSGSAFLNYAPGISEAFYQGRPLIVISADRPESFVGQMAGQTIQQQHSLDQFVKSFKQLSYQSEFQYNKRKIEEALLLMNKGLPGPIHFNLPIEEPFYGYNYHFNHQVNPVKFIGNTSISDPDFESIKSLWSSYNKVLILCGCLDNNTALNEELSRLSQDPRVVILTETTSNLHLEKSFDSIDNLLMQMNDPLDFEPELLITLGRNVVSKKVKAFLQKGKIKHHWSFDNEDHLIDTYNHLSHKFHVLPEKILGQLESLNHSSDFYKDYNSLETKSRNILANYLNDLTYCDFKAFEIILSSIPDHSVVHYANSSVVRYSNLFDLKGKKYLSFANRGTSGIDGSSSTAVGYASKSSKLNILITGDISFFYDSNALWNTSLPMNLKIVLINNGGGGIFDIIDGAKKSPANKDYLKYQQDFQVKGLSSTFNIDYYHVNDLNSLIHESQTFFDKSGISLLEIDTKKIDNAKQLSIFMQLLSRSSNKKRPFSL